MNWRYSMGDDNSSTFTHEEVLRQHAEEFLGPEKKLDDLEVWEQNRLLAEIEADLLGVDDLQPRLQQIHETELYRPAY